MTRIFIAAALALAVTLPAAPANAQAIRTFVSTAGSDSNPCSITLPCRHFSAAVAATSVGGEVDALDAGAYGSFTISQAITIEGQGWSYVAPPTNGAAITINAGSGNVNIRGVSLNGVGAAAVTNGIVFNSGSSLTIQDSVIRNFTQDGIAVNAPAAVSVSDTILSSNSNNGISFSPSAAATLMVERVQAIGNGNIGFLINGENAPLGAVVAGTVADCVASRNGDGILIQGLANTANPIFSVVNCKIANNTGVGIESIGSTATLAQTTISNNTLDGFGAGGNGGIIMSFGNNFITDTTNFGTLTPIAPR